MANKNLHFALATVVLLICQLFVLAPSTTAAKTNGRELRERWSQRAQEGKQMGFPYFMMMSSSNVALPSIWLVPVVIASCIMLSIRVTMD